MLSISSTDRREKRPRVKKRAHDHHIHPSPPSPCLSVSVFFFFFFWLNTRAGPASRADRGCGGLELELERELERQGWEVHLATDEGRRGSALGTPGCPADGQGGDLQNTPALPILAASISRTSPRSSCSASCSTSPPRTLLVAPECAVPSA